jgi:fatty acid desaturase
MGLKRIEWPTVVLAIVCTVAWMIAVYLIGVSGYWWLTPIAVLLITLHSSLQHEALHGHPTSNRRINEALVFLPVGLIFPYRRFRALHLKHHNDELLTDPFEDPETYYLSPEEWAKAGPVMQAIRTFNNMQVGRLVIGPALSILGLIRQDWRLISRGDRDVGTAWLLHLLGLVPVFLWVTWVSGIHPLVYFIAFAYPALSVLSVRTFIEHQARDVVSNRTIVNEDRGMLAFLFLNNNLHFVHHRNPTVAWYRLPRLYRDNRETFLRDNGGYHAKNYWQIFKTYALKRKEPVPHPVMAAGRWRAVSGAGTPAIASSAHEDVHAVSEATS